MNRNISESRNKLDLLCDMDCTIADLYPYFIVRHNEIFKTKLDPEKYLDYFGDHKILIPEVTKETLAEVFSTGHFFAELEPIEGSQIALERL